MRRIDIERHLGSKVEIVSSKPKKGYILRSASEPITFDKKKGERSAATSVIVTDADKSIKASLSTKSSLKGNYPKNLQKLVETMGVVAEL